MNHLFIQTAFLGDLLLSIPTLRQIRFIYPQCQLTLVCRKGYGDFINQLGLVDEIFEVDKGNKSTLWKKFSNRSFEIVFCPHQSFTTHRLVGKIKAAKKVGYKKWWNQSWFDISVERKLEWPEAIRQLQLLGAVDESISLKLEAFAEKEDSIPPWAEMHLNQLKWSEAEIQKLADKKGLGFKASEPYVCIAPGSVWATKRWPERSFIKASIELARSNNQIVILGAPDERPLCERIQGNVPNSYSFAGHLTILESLMLLSRSRGLLCNDSGAMHMASLLNLPSLAFFGPTVQELGYKPWNPKAEVLEENELLCRPCGQHGGQSCPIGTHRCMQDISVKTALDKSLDLFR